VRSGVAARGSAIGSAPLRLLYGVTPSRASKAE
jgi:hypothetical protein